MWILIRSEDKISAFLCSFVYVLLCVSFIQVKETGGVVLAGAYVDLHGAAEASPENLTQVCQAEIAPFEQQYFFSFHRIHGSLKVPSLLLFCRRNELVLLTHLRHENRPPVLFLPLCREEAFRASWCLQRLAVVSKTWAQSWSRR